MNERPNIGEALAQELALAAIRSAEELDQLGSLDAALRIEQSGRDVCANKLYALEGAIRRVRWHDIPVNERRALWAQYTQMRLI